MSNALLPPPVTLDQPAKHPEPTDSDLLREIRDLLKRREPNTGNGVVWQPIVINPGAASGAVDVQLNNPCANLFVVAVPRAVNVYAGTGGDFLLANLTTGQLLTAKLPLAVSAFRFTWAAGGATDVLTAYASSEPIDITVK